MMTKKNQWKLQKKLEKAFSGNPAQQSARDNFSRPRLIFSGLPATGIEMCYPPFSCFPIE